MAYSIILAPRARGHLGHLSARERAIVLRSIQVQLSHQPTIETRNRKRLRPNPLASWELRIGDLRVFYDVDDVIAGAVTIAAVGRKERDRVRVGDEEYLL